IPPEGRAGRRGAGILEVLVCGEGSRMVRRTAGLGGGEQVGIDGRERTAEVPKCAVPVDALPEAAVGRAGGSESEARDAGVEEAEIPAYDGLSIIPGIKRDSDARLPH